MRVRSALKARVHAADVLEVATRPLAQLTLVCKHWCAVYRCCKLTYLNVAAATLAGAPRTARGGADAGLAAEAQRRRVSVPACSTAYVFIFSKMSRTHLRPLSQNLMLKPSALLCRHREGAGAAATRIVRMRRGARPDAGKSADQPQAFVKILQVHALLQQMHTDSTVKSAAGRVSSPP